MLTVSSITTDDLAASSSEMPKEDMSSQCCVSVGLSLLYPWQVVRHPLLSVSFLLFEDKEVLSLVFLFIFFMYLAFAAPH